MNIFQQNVWRVVAITVSIAASASLVACSKGTSNGQGPVPYIEVTPQTQGLSTDSLPTVLMRSSLTCADKSSPAACPDNVGLILTRESTEFGQIRLGQCTGFLISPSLVATNSHCIPNSIKLRGLPSSECANELAIRFLPSSGNKRGAYACRRVISATTIKSVLNPDVAFFEIETTGIKPIEISKSGFKTGAKITTVNVTPVSSETIGGTLSSRSCTAITKSLLNPNGVTGKSDLGLATDCAITQGNSGSPVLNEDGQAIGVAQAHFQSQIIGIYQKLLNQFGLELPSELPKHFLFTNFSCTSDPVRGDGDRDLCAKLKQLTPLSCTEFNNEQLQAHEKSILENWQSTLPKIFKYRFEFHAKSMTHRAEPLCVRRKSKANAADYDLWVSRNWRDGFSQRITGQFSNSLALRSKMQTDSVLRVVPEIRLSEKYRGQVTVNLVRAGASWQGVIQDTFPENFPTSGPLQNELEKLNRTLRDLRAALSRENIRINLNDCAENQESATEEASVVLEDGTRMSTVEYLKSVSKINDLTQCDP